MKTWLITLSLFFFLFSNNQLTAQLYDQVMPDKKEASHVSTSDEDQYRGLKNNTPKRSIISVYPNPARHNLYIEGHYAFYNLFNNSGKKILSDNKARLDVSHLRPGMYVMTIHSRDGHYQSKRIMIR